MRSLSTLLILAGFFVSSFLQAEEHPLETPYGDAANDLSLERFHELKALLKPIMASELTQAIEQDLGGASAPKVNLEQAQAALRAGVLKHQVELVKALNSAQPLQRELAAQLLQHAEKASALDPLLNTARKDPDAAVRFGAVNSVASFQDAHAVDELIKVLEDKEEHVRAITISALAKIKDPRAVEPLLKVVTSDDRPANRMRAAMALKHLDDKSALNGLLQALIDEEDQRVRMAIAEAIRSIRGKDIPSTAGVPETQNHEDALNKMAENMRKVEEMLRNDRHDQAVQVTQQQISEDLAAMIKQLEEMAQSQSSGNQEQQKQQQGQQQKQQQGQGQNSGKSQSPLKDTPPPSNTERGALRVAEVSAAQEEWAKLPPAMREQLLQNFRDDAPERWKKRIEAYLYSIAKEESTGQ